MYLRVAGVILLAVASSLGNCSYALAETSAADCRLERFATTPQIYPSPLCLYGPQTYANATPMCSPLDNFYSGAILRPLRLDCWYGNGYNW